MLHTLAGPFYKKYEIARDIAIVVLSQLVNIWFQVLFHSPPGVLFNFPSRYYTLSVTRSYLALGDGPPTFMPDSTCPALLWILTLTSQTFNLRGYYPVSLNFPKNFGYV